MFSDDLDKALATFVLANAHIGEKLQFSSLSGIKCAEKVKKPKVKKIFGKMFG